MSQPTQNVPRDLSRRQLQVLSRVSNGMTNPEIATDLGIGLETVKTHLRQLRILLGARSRAHAVAIAFRTGVLATARDLQPQPAKQTR